MTSYEPKVKRLEGKKVFITGAGSGIGKAIALRFAAEGADIAINDINEVNAEQTAKEVRALGQDALVYIADITDSESVQNMAKSYFKEWKELDILVNNAGVGGSTSLIMQMKEDIFDRIMRINARGLFLMCKYFLKYMKRRKVPEGEIRGKIINLASMRGIKGRDKFGAYSASKAAVIRITETLAIEMGKYNMPVNAIAPGLIHTPIYGDVSYENLVVMGEDVCLPKKAGFPEDVAGVAFFLASSDSDWITGHVIPVSGGQFGLI